MMDQIGVANALLKWDGSQPPEPLLWLKAGRPKLPASEQLFAIETDLLHLIEAFRYRPATLPVQAAPIRSSPDQRIVLLSRKLDCDSSLLVVFLSRSEYK